MPTRSYPFTHLHNSFQMPIIEKIRDIIKQNDNNGHNSSKSSDDDSSNKNEEDKFVSEEDILESLGLKNVARNSNGKIDHGKLSMKDRMAIVRGNRKRRRKGGGLVPGPPRPGTFSTGELSVLGPRQLPP